MRVALKERYARLRRRRIVGAIASRLVWAIKGALGRPVCSPGVLAPQRTIAPLPAPDLRMRIALSAADALLERTASAAPMAYAPPARGRAPATISVIVCTLDRAEWLDKALTALAYQRHAALEIIVVIGPCRDNTDAVAARHATAIRVARCAEANLSAARNIGLALASGDVVAFLDDDATPEPDWLEQLLSAYADPQIGGVGGYIRDASGVGWQCGVVVADRLGRSQPREALDPSELDAPGPGVRRYLSLTGANSSFRRDALLQIGGFDEAYTYFLDETDVCLRLVEAGWRLTVAPAAEVHHAYAPNAERDAARTPKRLIACVRSTAYFAMRHAAPHQGMAVAADHLQAYAAGLHADTLWRQDHGLVTPDAAARMLAEIEDGIVQGVRQAAAPPRRLKGLAPPANSPRRPLRAQRIEPPLKLCLLCQDYPQAGGDPSRPPGGIAIWTQALTHALAAKGHEVTVIAHAQAAPAVAYELGPVGGAWVHRVAARPEERALRRPPLLAGVPDSVADPALSAAAEVRRMTPRRRFDLVMGPLWDLEPAAVLGRSDGVQAVSLHTACAQVIRYKPEWSDAYRRAHVDRVVAAERRLLASAPHVLSNTHAAVRDIAAALDLPDLASRACVIAHGLPDLAAGVAAALRAERVEILFVGRLERRKGVDVLLDAAPRLLTQAPHARLTLVGEAVDAPSREQVFACHAGAPWLARLDMPGPLPRAELLARYAAADIVVTPSRYESFGLTALEAMIFAKPCVASRVGGLPELVEDGVTGLLVAPDDPRALADALLRLAHDPALARRLGLAARRRYEARFTAEHMAQAFEHWARSLIEPGRRMAAE